MIWGKSGTLVGFVSSKILLSVTSSSINGKAVQVKEAFVPAGGGSVLGRHLPLRELLGAQCTLTWWVRVTENGGGRTRWTPRWACSVRLILHLICLEDGFLSVFWNDLRTGLTCYSKQSLFSRFLSFWTEWTCPYQSRAPSWRCPTETATTSFSFWILSK